MITVLITKIFRLPKNSTERQIWFDALPYRYSDVDCDIFFICEKH